MMRGGSINSGVHTGVVLSLLLHGIVVLVASTVPFTGELPESGARSGMLNGSQASFDLSDPALLTPTPPNSPEQRNLTALLIPPEPTPKPLTPEELEQKLILGIDESNQKTQNWMGFANPTPHAAPLSTVEQPLLDPNPGIPGAPAPVGVSQNGPQAPMVPDTTPAETQAEPTPTEARPAREGVKGPESTKPVGEKPREGVATGIDQLSNPAPREGEANGTGDKHTRPKRGTPDLARPDPTLPGPAPVEPGELMDPAPDTTIPEAATPETIKKVEPTRESAPTTEILAHPEPMGPPAPRTPSTALPTTASAPMPAGGPTVSSAPGATGEHAGEQSPKEADASSTTATVEIRPGRPAAAQGLDITTKRPNFTRLTRVTAYPQNPLLKVTFNRNGIVSKVVLAESSGIPDVDGPVMNAVYQWTAKGKILAEISAADPNGGITVSVRILLR